MAGIFVLGEAFEAKMARIVAAAYQSSLSRSDIRLAKYACQVSNSDTVVSCLTNDTGQPNS